MDSTSPLSARADTAQVSGPQSGGALRRAQEASQSAATPQTGGPGDATAVAASAAFGSGLHVVTDIVMGPHNQLAGIRVIDPVTHEVIASTPPDSIARMQQEIFAYQNLVKKAASSLQDAASHTPEAL